MRERNIVKNVHYKRNCIHLFVNYKSTAMNITNYVVTLFKYEIIIDIPCSLKTALNSILINETPGNIFSSLVSMSSSFILKLCISKNVLRAA